MAEATQQTTSTGEMDFRAGASDENAGFSTRTLLWILASAACYYLATHIAWLLCFADSKVSLFFFPHAILVSILLLVPTRLWWAYALAAAASHFIATQQADWPPLYALHCEAFDAVKAIATAAGIRWFIRSPFHLISLREAVTFVLIAVIIVPVTVALWGAALTIANGFGTQFWVEWRNLAVSNGVTTIVLVPAILSGVRQLHRKEFKVAPARVAEACALVLGLFAVGWLAFDRVPAGPDTSPALIYLPVPLLIWAALRFGLGGTSASILVITIMAILGTMQGRGPFLTQAPSENALALQLFMLMAATPLTLLAVAIVDERRSKDALRFTEARMSLAAESAQLALWEWDMANDKVWIQDKGLFGFSPDAPVDHSTLAGHVHPEDRAIRALAIERAMGNGGHYESEFRVILDNGEVRWLTARGRSPVPVHNGVPERILGVAIDITQQKKAREEMQVQREELVHLSRVATVSALSGSLAHELSQPLCSILTNAQAGQRFMAQDSPNVVEVRAIFEDIVTADLRAGEIIERLRTMLRRGEIALKPVRIKECLEELLRLSRGDHIARRVSVTNLLADDLPPAMTDRIQFQQVLLNLIVNACDAMESNPPEDRVVTLTASVVQNELHVGVLDRGVGLPQDIDALFQPFHSTKEGGLGMGLSICRSLLVSHGGRLWAERRPDRGAAFYVSLPLATP